MDSTGRSTPNSEDDGSSSPFLLTPNAKIKALLAKLDKPESVTQNLSARDHLLATMSKPSSSRIKKANPFLDTSDEEDANDFISPKGRIASAMRVNENSKDKFSFESKLQEEKTSSVLESPTFDVTAHSNGDDGDGDNESDPITPRNRRHRFTRHRTPKSITMRNSASPSLFVSPHTSLLPRSNSPSSDSDPFSEDLPKNLSKNSKFMALVQKKKKEQLALQTKINKIKLNKQVEKQEKQKPNSTPRDSENTTDTADSDEELGHRLTQQSQRRRKASKKALEDINRETQRIMRQQQLSHKPMIKKKITKESLFSKFNFRPQKNSDPIQPICSSSATNKSDSDVQDTPPTSPLKSHNDNFKELSAMASSHMNEVVRERGSSEEIFEITPRSLSPRLTQSNENSYHKAEERNYPKTQSRVQSKSNFDLTRTTSIGNKYENKVSDGESDSDLEIVGEKFTVQGRLIDVFDRVPIKKSREANGFHALKMLAQLRSPTSKQKVNSSQSISTTELHISLQQRARKQAAIEREERLEQLKAKGVIIQTNEERQIDQANFDDLLSKARDEAEQLRKQEVAAKKKQTDNIKKNELTDDSTEDEDWKKDKDKRHPDLSGSDSNDGDETGLSDVESIHDVQDDENNSEATIVEVFTVKDLSDVQNEVDYTSIEQQNIVVTSNIVDPEEDESTPQIRRSNVRNRIIISDDEDDTPEVHNIAPLPPGTGSSIYQTQPQTPSHEASTSVLRSATKTFIPGLPISGPAGLGLTQIFTGTMDDSQVSFAACSSESSSGHKRTDILRQAALIPSSLLSPKEASQLEQAAELSQISRISESQNLEPNLEGNQSLSSLLEDKYFQNIIQDTQLNQTLEPTQDLGFGELTPIKGRFDERPPSRTKNIDYRTEVEFKVGKGKKRLYRKAPEIASFSDEETYGQEKTWQPTDDPFQDDIDSNLEENVFDVLIKASKKKKDYQTLFDKKESKAKDLFNEQAEESDDEYAGLGGLSDDSGIDEEDQFAKDMIDDEGEEDVDETDHAAFFAERERVNNEKQVEKLYNDISRGMLRRKRGAEYELSDSDDDGEARRRRKRQEFAKMRKALLADERVSKIANNPKSQAFLQAIEDRGSSEEDNFLFEPEEKEEDQDSQNQSQSEVISESQSGSVDDPAKITKKSEINSRLSHYFRPANTCKKPSSLSEIRFSLSNILDEPNSIEPVDSSSESELDNEAINHDSILDKDLNNIDNETAEPLSSNTTRKKRPVVIDRISLKKNLTASSSSNDSRLLFIPSSSANSFTVPSLLRSTTNSSVTSSTYSSTNSSVIKTTERTAGSENCGVKRGGTWGSGLNSFSRESERRAKMIKTETRREKKLIQSAISRRSLVGGLLGTGKFE